MRVENLNIQNDESPYLLSRSLVGVNVRFLFHTRPDKPGKLFHFNVYYHKKYTHTLLLFLTTWTRSFFFVV